MSTKIYEAWRFPAHRVNLFLQHVDAHMFPRIVERVRLLMTNLKDEVVEKKAKEYLGIDRKEKPEDYKLHERYMRFEATVDLSRNAAEKAHRDPYFDLECGWNFFFYPQDRRMYALPWGEAWTREGLVMPKWVHEYAYWNNTDAPEQIGQKEWDARGRTWDKVALDDDRFQVRRLTHSVVDLSHGGIESRVRLQMALFPPKEEAKSA